MGSECPSCGQDAAPQARFCTACGRPLDATSPLGASGFFETGYRQGPAPAPAQDRPDSRYRPGPAPAPGPADRRADSRWGRAIAILAVLALMSGGAGVYVGMRSHWFSSGGSQAGPEPSAVGLAGSTTAASDGSAAPSPAELAQLRRITPLIRRSAAARVAVAAAVQQAGRCHEPPGRAAGVLRHAIAQRRADIGRARALPTSAIANGPALVGFLVQALRQSSAADRGFIGWLQDKAGRHSCPLSTARNHSYQVGLAASGRATEAKASFLQLWNPLAREFAQPVFTAGGI
jgi:hypothetical protein